MRRAKSIDELYDEVRNYDLVITNDAALSTALNGRVDVPRIGGFAYTPRHIAGKEAVRILGTNIWGDLKLISALAEDTGYDIKFIHSELENIRTIRRYTMEVEKHLHSKRSRRIYEMFLRLPSMEKVMSLYDPMESDMFRNMMVAVIGVDLFDDLDKHFIPMDHDEIDIFIDDDYAIDTIHDIGNDRQLAENIADLIDMESANDVAIVMDTDGAIADAVRAALYRRRIPFRNTVSVRDLSQVRDFLQYLTLGLSYDTLRVRHIRELFSSYGGRIDHKYDEYLLSRVSGLFERRIKELTDAMRDLRDLTFAEICDRIVKNEHKPQIKILIGDLGISDSKVSSRLVNELVYAVNNINDLHHNEEIPDDEKKGALLVDCRRSVYVDRSFVIYLGMGPEWSENIVGKGYIDRETEAEKNIIRFTALLQQGSKRLYGVNSMRGGRESIPSPVFDQMAQWIPEQETGKVVSRFSDVCDEVIVGQWYVPPVTFLPPCRITESGDLDGKRWTFTKSSFNRYFRCPMAFMFGELIHGPDSDSTMFGNVIHDFTELYICYPEIVRNEYGRCVEIAKERYSGLSSPQLERIDDSKIKICTGNVIRFVDSLGVGDVPLDRDNSERKYRNMFMESFGCEKYSSLSESEFTSKLHPLYGKMDLVTEKGIIDYKTGKVKNLRETMEQMDPLKEQNYYEFQSMIYLSLLREHVQENDLMFDLFYVNDNNFRSVTDPRFNISENIRRVCSTTLSFREWFSGDDFPREHLTAKNQEPIRVAWTGFVNTILSFNLDPTEKWEMNGELISALLSATGMNDVESKRSPVKSAVKKTQPFITSGMGIANGRLIIPQDTLERFLRTVDELHIKASGEMALGFSLSPRGDCRKCDFFDVCTHEVILPDEEVSD